MDGMIEIKWANVANDFGQLPYQSPSVELFSTSKPCRHDEAMGRPEGLICVV